MLGLIAGLTVPSIVVSVDKSNNKAKIKEAFQTLTAITQEGVLNGDFASITDWNLTTSTNPKGIVGYITSKLNYSKQCLTTDTTSEGCKRGGQASLPTVVLTLITPAGFYLMASSYKVLIMVTSVASMPQL